MDDGGKMENVESGLVSVDEGVSSEGAVQTDLAPVVGDQVQEPTGAAAPPRPQLSAEELAKLPPELRPNADGTYPAITPKLLKALRGRYFTVKHVRLEQCGHRLDMINEPRNNCQNCWWQWFLHHPQLVETTDQFFRTQGKGPLIGMRGKKYFTMFVRFMATYIRFQKEAEELANQKTTSSADQQSEIPSGQKP